MTPLEQARSYFQKDRFATEAAGIQIDAVAEGYAKCSLTITPLHQNATGQVMGGAIFTLADFTFAVAANFNAPSPTVSAVSNVSFLSPAKGSRLFGESHRIKNGKRTCFYQIQITDDLGTLVALVTMNGVHLG